MSADSKHTPGPWSTDEDMGCVWGPDGEPIMTNGANAVRGTAEGWANARLIASAPDLAAEVQRLRAEREELLGALEDCARAAGNMEWADAEAIASAAIEKARATNGT